MPTPSSTLRLGLLVALSLLLAPLQSALAQARFLSARDTVRINTVGSPAISPDGEWVLYTQAERDLDAEIDVEEELERRTHVWRARIDGSQRRQLTFGDVDSSAPAWHPAGDRICFLAARGKKSGNGGGNGGGENGGPKQQVHCMWTDGGEAWSVTEHDEGVQSFRWSPDGSTIAFLARDPLSKEKKKRNKLKDDTIVVDAEFRWTHLWHWNPDEAEDADRAKRLTEGDFSVSDIDWAPDGSQIAYVTRPTTKLDDGWNSDVWAVDVASGDARKLHENPGTDASPRWSPDGSTIAFTSKPQLRTNTWYSKLFLVPAAGGEPRVLLGDFDRDLSTPIWSPDGDTIFWSTGDRTSSRLFAVDVASGEVTRQRNPVGSASGWDLSEDGKRWVWRHTAPDWPAEIHAAALDFSDVTRLSDANPWLRDEGVQLATPRAVTWKNSDGQEIEGVLTVPPDYREGERYPFILNPHGGPSGAVTTSFSSGNQFLAGNGFIVLQPNFRGSSNYGQEFLNANRDQWGKRDYDDCMTGVDHAIEQGWADPDRMVAYGWSYGGYMSFWISTQTDRFKVVSPGAGLSNLYSMYSTTDVSHYLGWFFGTPWDNEEIYRQLSPIRHAKKVKSKVLIMTGAEDARVPPEQSVEFHRALKDLDKDVELVIYPREGHGIREPRHQMDRLRRWLDAFATATGVDQRSEARWREAVEEAESESEEDSEADD